MDWLNRIFDKILALFPMVTIVNPYEAGVMFTFGKYYRVKGAGWYIIWPLIQRFVWMEVQSQLVDLRNQSLKTKDNHDIVVSGAIQYSIKDVEKAVINVQDVEKAIETLSLGIIFDFVNSKTSEELRDVESLRVEILKGLREAARGWGVKIEKIFITDLGKTRNIRLLTNPISSGD